MQHQHTTKAADVTDSAGDFNLKKCKLIPHSTLKKKDFGSESSIVNTLKKDFNFVHPSSWSNLSKTVHCAFRELSENVSLMQHTRKQWSSGFSTCEIRQDAEHEG